MDKKANFRRLAEKRVQRTMHDLRLIGNLSNRGNYCYDESEVSQMFMVLESEVKKARRRFETQAPYVEPAFKFR